MSKLSRTSARLKYFRNAFFVGTFALTSLFLNPASANAIPAEFGLSPDNSLDLLLKTLKRSQKEAVINIYQLSEPHVMAAITELMKNNVAVSILLEGQPAPTNQYTNEIKAIVLALQNAITQSPTPSLHKLFVMMKRYNSTQARRYTYNHAKYVVIDRHLALIASENFTPTGHPMTGHVGNRGWEVVLDSSSLSLELLELFHEDTRLEFGDVANLTPKPLAPSNPRSKPRRPSDQVPPAKSPTPVRTATRIESRQGEVTSTEFMTSPNALPPVQKLLQAAKKSVALEYMSLPKAWSGSLGATSNDVIPAGTNPVIAELIQTAQRGVQVRVLLNDDRVFSRAPGKSLPNFSTVSFLENTARCFSLPLEARIVDVKATQITYVHNKGMLVDDDKVLVSSINGTKNSYMNNREVAVLLKSTDASHYYGNAFDWDWNQTPAFHLTPVDFPLPPSPCASLTQTMLGSFSPFSTFR